MKSLVKGLHHVTATVNEAQEDYDFYVKLLGQRLVKETVNFDNEAVYHFYYGNRLGTPSTIFTTFPYAGQGVKKGVIGAGQVFETTFCARPGSLPYWEQRLQHAGIEISSTQRFGKDYLVFKDPSGLNLSLMEDIDDRMPIWESGDIPKEKLITGIDSVICLVTEAKPTVDFLINFGYSMTDREQNCTRFTAGEDAPGNRLYVQENPNAKKGVNGIGTVHHVAHRVAQIDDSLQIKSAMEQKFGLKVTEVRDRKYFKSIYFRIPGGILFEVATVGPGFDVDESEDQLGTQLKLPEWQEPHRERITKALPMYQK